MYILISILVIIFVLLGLYTLWLYNQFIRLQINTDNTIADIAHDLDKLFITLDSNTQLKKATKTASDARVNAKTRNDRIIAFNLLEPQLETLADHTHIKKYLINTLSGRRYYNHSTKLLNAKLKIFPSNILGSILGYEEAPLFVLTKQEQEGETPIVKRA